MILSKHTPGKPLSAAELRQRREAARSRWKVAAGGTAAGAVIGAGILGGRRAVIATAEALADQITAEDQRLAARTRQREQNIREEIARRKRPNPETIRERRRRLGRTLGSRTLEPGPVLPQVIGNASNARVYDYQIARLTRHLNAEQRHLDRLISAAGDDHERPDLRRQRARVIGIQRDIAHLEVLKSKAPRATARAPTERQSRRAEQHLRDLQNEVDQAKRLFGLDLDEDAVSASQTNLENQVRRRPVSVRAHIMRAFRHGETTPQLEERIARERRALDQVRARLTETGNLGAPSLSERADTSLRDASRARILSRPAQALRDAFLHGDYGSRILRSAGRGAALGAGIGLTAAGLGILAHHVIAATTRGTPGVEKIAGAAGGELAKARRAPPEDQMSLGLAMTFRRWIDRLLGRNDEPMNLADGIAEAMAPGLTQAYAQGLTNPPIDTEGADPSGRRIDFNFDVLNPSVRRHMAEYALDRIVQITDSQRAAIRDALMQQSVLQGIGPLEVARTIRQSIGLTAYQRGVVESFRVMLQQLDPRALERKLRDRRYDRTLKRAIDTNTPLTPEQINAMVDAYHRRMLALRAQTIARTEALRATSYGGLARAQQVLDENPGLEVTKRWLATDDDRTRDTHVDLNGREVDGMTTNFITSHGNQIRWPLDENAVADETINCLLPGTRVFAPDLLAASKREYDGDVVTFELTNGMQISCTINHPIMTDRGWSAAQFLEKGDRVVGSAQRNWMSAIDDDQQRHPRIEDLEHTIKLAGGATASKIGMGVDFHGERVAGQIEVVLAENDLALSDDATIGEHHCELSFSRTDLVAEALASGCLFGEPLRRLLTATDRSMSGRDLRLALALAHLVPFSSLSFAATADSAAVFGENSRDDMARDAMLVGECFDRNSTIVSGQKANQAWRFPSSVGVNSWPSEQVKSADILTDGCRGDAQALAHLVVKQASLIELNEVVAINRRRWHGHVYNLETRSGIYLAGAALSHNCRCTLQFIFKPKRGQLMAVAA